MSIIHSSNPLSEIIAEYQQLKHLKFIPDESFYKVVGINKIRFWQLVRGKKVMLTNEARSLADYFNVPVTSLL